MDKGFGIAALVFAIIAIFIPFGIIISAISIICAVVAALAGDRAFAVATSVIVLVNTFFMSPSTWIFLAGIDPNVKGVMTVLLILISILPIGAVALNAAGKVAIGSRRQS